MSKLFYSRNAWWYTAAMSPQTPDLSLIKEIKSQSLRGAMGVQRKEYVRRYRQTLELIYDEIKTASGPYLQSGGDKHITCGKGCTSCCFQFVSVNLAHALLIVDYLYSGYKAMPVFLKGYEQWLSSFENNPRAMPVLNSLEESTTRAAAMKHYSQELCTDYHKLDIACPFLDEGQCSIHEARPVVCASYFSVSPVEQCRADSDSPPFILRHTPSEIYLRRMAALADIRWYTHQEPLPTLVYKLLTQGLPEVSRQIEGLFESK
jgi:Fe-S-cluster containining protein